MNCFFGRWPAPSAVGVAVPVVVDVTRLPAPAKLSPMTSPLLILPNWPFSKNAFDRLPGLNSADSIGDSNDKLSSPSSNGKSSTSFKSFTPLLVNSAFAYACSMIIDSLDTDGGGDGDDRD